MTTQERNQELRKQRARIKRRRQVVKRRMVLLLAALFVITIGGIVCGTIFSSAKDPATDLLQYKYYKSITIKQGESLWSIAEEYRTDAYDDTRAYVDEVIELNDLHSETIHEGQHLVVAYYDTIIR